MALRAPPATLLRHPQLGPLLVEFLWTVILVLVERPHLLTGLRLTSWYRSAEENVAAGGATLSQHLLGLAVDLAYVDGVGDLAALAEAFGDFGFVQVELEDDPHVHVQLLPASQLLEALAA